MSELCREAGLQVSRLVAGFYMAFFRSYYHRRFGSETAGGRQLDLRKTETLSSGDLLLTLIAWCSAQHSADLAQAGRRQSLADQQHRLF